MIKRRITENLSFTMAIFMFPREQNPLQSSSHEHLKAFSCHIPAVRGVNVIYKNVLFCTFFSPAGMTLMQKMMNWSMQLSDLPFNIHLFSKPFQSLLGSQGCWSLFHSRHVPCKGIPYKLHSGVLARNRTRAL